MARPPSAVEQPCRMFVPGFYDWYWNRDSHRTKDLSLHGHEVDPVTGSNCPALSPESIKQWGSFFAALVSAGSGRWAERSASMDGVLLTAGGPVPDATLESRVTAGTSFDRRRVPLQDWYPAAWYMTKQKHGLSALGREQRWELASYRTASIMLHKLRARRVAGPGLGGARTWRVQRLLLGRHLGSVTAYDLDS